MILNSTNELEKRRQHTQARIDASKSASERNRLGQFATPFALALDIARFVGALIEQRREKIRFADPAIGTGSFFSAALAAYGHERIERAVGVELDPVFVGAARELWGESGLEVIHGDFSRIIAESPPPLAPNLLLANPPYVRHHHLSRVDKERLQHLVYRMAGVEVNGLAGLYVYFVLLATAWMADGGYAAWLIPSEFMDVNYGSALKQFLLDRVTLFRVHRFHPNDVQFGDALVSSVIVVFRKSLPPLDHEPEFTLGGTLDSPNARERVPLAVLRGARKWTAFPSAAESLPGETNGEGVPLFGDLFLVRRGIATGGNKFFILDRADAMRRGFPDEYLRPILPSPRRLKETVIEADENGYPLLDPRLCVIDCDLPEHVVEDRHPALWKYLLTAESLGIREGYLVGKRNPWYRQEQREPAPFLCTYMGRGADEKRPFRFVLNRSRAIASNLYLMLHPRRGLTAMLRRHPERVVDVHRLLCGITGRELRGEGRVYGGGLHKIEPSELGRISAAAFVEQWPELGEGLRPIEAAGLFE